MATAQRESDNQPDGDLEIEVARLVAELSMDERIGLMSGDGSFIRGTLAMSKRYNGEPIIAGEVKRLGLPGIRFTDGPRGVVMYSSTAFPVPMARGATFDPELEARIGDAIGVEARTQGANLFAGVCINLLRHPAWGRAQETYGEDTHLLGEMGAALVRGTRRHVLACVKHFAVNSMENSRLWVDVKVDERDLHDIYLPHFKRCVDEGAESVMSAYNAVNGERCGHSRRLLTEILKDQWGFDGFVMSDFTYGISNAERAANGGMDSEMPYRWRFRSLRRLVRSGRVHGSRINDAAERVVRAQLRADRRGEPDRYVLEAVAGPAHRNLAREAAARSVVLLRNEQVPDGNGSAAPVLPITSESVRSVAVIGRLAAEENIGDLGSSQVHPPEVVTILDGLRAAGVRHDIVVRHHESKSESGEAHDHHNGAIALAEECDVAVVVVGCTFRDEGEWIIRAGGDRKSLRLRSEDEELIARVARACPRTVVVLMGGSAIVTDRWHHLVPAVAMAWYPGMEGGHGVADMLFGEVDAQGRLPLTWPGSSTHLPTFKRFARKITYGPLHGYRMMEATSQTPSFPFGHGLSYAPSSWSGAQISRVVPSGPGERTITVSVVVDVHNDSDRDAVDVVQGYAAEVLGSHATALRTLRGFTRVEIPAGATVRAELEMSIPADSTEVFIGRSSAMEDLTSLSLS